MNKKIYIGVIALSLLWLNGATAACYSEEDIKNHIRELLLNDEFASVTNEHIIVYERSRGHASANFMVSGWLKPEAQQDPEYSNKKWYKKHYDAKKEIVRFGSFDVQTSNYERCSVSGSFHTRNLE